MRFFQTALASTAVASQLAAAITLDITNEDSIKSAASTVAHEMMKYYTGNNTGDIPGTLPNPYYWWEAGAMMTSLIDYWHFTGDDTYNNEIQQAILWQASPTLDFMPPNQTKDEGNDDQVFWGYAAMNAAEYNFPDPPSNQPQWLTLAIGVFNSQVARWDNTSCAGGLKWQIFPFNAGYDYKNSPSNGGFFNLAARLGAYTGNQTYFDWADRMYTWMADIGMVSSSFQVWDGTNDLQNCTSFDHNQWTYNAGLMLHGAAAMWSHDNSSEWYDRAQGLWKSSNVFFKNNIMLEVACEAGGNCDTDQLSFKAAFTRFLASAIKVAPFLYDDVMPFINASAQAAAAQCTGGTAGTTCGTKWWDNGVWDGTYGVGQQMCALEIIQSTLVANSKAPVTNSTGGTSKGDTSAGTSTGTNTDGTPVMNNITGGDKAGAGFLTALILIVIIGGTWWLLT